MKTTKIQLVFSLIGISLLFSGCSDEERSDAYGQFEATETTISSKIPGELLSFMAEEGLELAAGQQVGLVDTVQLSLQKEELQAQLKAIQSRISNIDAEVAVQNEQLQTALTNQRRMQALAEENAATQQQLDDAGGRVRTLQKQMDALETQKMAVQAEVNATRARISQIEKQLKDTRIINPVRGTVLTTYAEPHELVSQGKPLYQIANLDTLILRVYVSGAQLPAIRLGQTADVIIDKNAEENQTLEGRVSWIASEAEFTPGMVQTKEERVNQVYAVKLRVSNSGGILKIGMPGEVNFGD